MADYEGFRDAIHVPFIVLKAKGDLVPGAKCSLRDSQQLTYLPWSVSDEIDWHGVVDPFLVRPVVTGELFRLFIRKECFSGLTHNFTIEVHDRGGTDTCHQVCDIF